MAEQCTCAHMMGRRLCVLQLLAANYLLSGCCYSMALIQEWCLGKEKRCYTLLHPAKQV
jgi:hypothetical protein